MTFEDRLIEYCAEAAFAVFVVISFIFFITMAMIAS